jgi:hypothetical protein
MKKMCLLLVMLVNPGAFFAMKMNPAQKLSSSLGLVQYNQKLKFFKQEYKHIYCLIEDGKYLADMTPYVIAYFEQYLKLLHKNVYVSRPGLQADLGTAVNVHEETLIEEPSSEFRSIITHQKNALELFKYALDESSLPALRIISDFCGAARKIRDCYMEEEDTDPIWLLNPARIHQEAHRLAFLCDACS